MNRNGFKQYLWVLYCLGVFWYKGKYQHIFLFHHSSDRISKSKLADFLFQKWVPTHSLDMGLGTLIWLTTDFSIVTTEKDLKRNKWDRSQFWPSLGARENNLALMATEIATTQKQRCHRLGKCREKNLQAKLLITQNIICLFISEGSQQFVAKRLRSWTAKLGIMLGIYNLDFFVAKKEKYW